MILVVSHPEDAHATRVLDLLRHAGERVALLDVSDLPHRAMLTMAYEDQRLTRLAWTPHGCEAIDLLDVQSVWWRRPQAPDVSAFHDPDVRAFTHNEWNEAVSGLWQLVRAPWMNPPAADEVASRKALQLRLAAELGLRVPRTLITSDPAEARAFIGRHGVGRTVFKTFSCTHAIWRETRLVGEAELGLLEQVRLAPVIFQEYVPAGADLRVTIVGHRTFTAAIYAGATDYPCDFRMSLGQARTEPAELPPDVAARLLALLGRLGLVYAAIDLRRTPEGEHVFLEVNTAGEFLFVEERTGLPIAAAVAEWLATPSSR